MPILTAAALVLAAAPPGQVRVVPEPTASAATAQDGVTIFLLNEGDTTTRATPPDQVAAMAADGTALRLVPVETAARTIAPGAFAAIRYRPAPAVAAASAPAQPATTAETALLTGSGTHAGFLDRIEPHAPIYGAFGYGSDGAKLQFSLAFRPFDRAGLLDGIRVAWTQTMAWRIDLDSGPFRSTDYNPEVYYDLSLSDRTVAAAGYSHTSNGRGMPGSIDVNRIFARVAHRVPLGRGWTVDVVPQAWVYVGTGYRDVDRYWGNVSLGTTVMQDDGLKLEAALRNPFASRGAAELFVSYPLATLGGGTGLYLFGQGFVGHGEFLDDYRRRVSTARLGLAFTR